ncbi:MAG: hypothetical protein U5L72_10330 [Bacteroidales bacterium]|nr:hypothetical protein [Bacteroidales bacterium]
MAEINKQEIQSQELQEVMAGIPGSFLRWGLFLFFALLVAIIAISWFINSATIVSAPVVITTQNPPAPLVAKSGGKIASLCVRNQENALRNNLLHLLRILLIISDVKTLTSFIDKIQRRPDWNQTVEIYDLPLGLSLGEIQNSYARFYVLWQTFREYLIQAYISQKIDLLEEQIKKQEEYTIELLNQKELAGQELQLVANGFFRDSYYMSRAHIQFQ